LPGFPPSPHPTTHPSYQSALASLTYPSHLRELKNYPSGEVNEMIELYEAQGLSKADASQVIRTMAK
jgi:hypothetical protein